MRSKPSSDAAAEKTAVKKTVRKTVRKTVKTAAAAKESAGKTKAGKKTLVIKENTMPGIFQAKVKKYGDRDCVRYRKDGKYVPWSWNEMNSMVRDLSCFLAGRGISKKDRVALFSGNRYEWWVCDLGILSAGAADVPVYATDSPEEAEYILKNSGAKICFVSTEDHLNRVLKVKRKLPELKLIVVFDEVSSKKRGVISFKEALAEGHDSGKPGDFEKRLADVKPSDVATIIYTSGTTGAPKGVMLTHDNFVKNMLQSVDCFTPQVTENDIFFSILPLSHALERTTGYYCAVYVGGTVAFVEDVSKTLMRDLAAVRPTVMVSVPRIFEKIHAAVLSKLNDASSFKKFIFSAAMKVANRNVQYTCTGKKRTGFFALQYSLFDSLVFAKLRSAVGFDRINFVVSGGGPLSVSDAEFFMGMGICICEGYGMTETSPVTNANRPGLMKPGTVGPALKDTEVKISDDGEILIRGPQVMKGYYRDRAATKEAMTADGFIKTGDKGVIDEDGYLAITGRIKDVIITAGGKNISPQNIEGKLKESLFIEQAALIGDRRKYLSALIVPEFDELKKWAARNGIVYSALSDLVKKEEVIRLYTDELAKYMASFARVEQIRRFRLMDHGWSQETGELTPSLKVKRHVIEEKYAAEINDMYADA